MEKKKKKMQNIIDPLLVIVLISLAFWAKNQDNWPLLITLSFLLILLSAIIFFGLKLDKITGLNLYILALLLNVVSILKMIQRDFKFHWVGLFIFASFYIVFLILDGWFKKVKKGVKYIGYFVFIVELVFSVFLIGINKSFIQQGALLFFFHSLIFMLVLTMTEVHPDTGEKDGKDNQQKK